MRQLRRDGFVAAAALRDEMVLAMVWMEDEHCSRIVGNLVVALGMRTCAGCLVPSPIFVRTSCSIKRRFVVFLVFSVALV